MKPLRIGVFGSSEPVEGDALYESARDLGALLAEAGFTVVTGGYGGVMEASSRGARGRGGSTIGVTCRTFAGRTPNAFLEEERTSEDLFDRTRGLIEACAGFVVLAGKAGTLAELAFLWALHRAGCLGRRPVVLLGRRWQTLLDTLREQQMLDAEQREITTVVETPDEAVAAVRVRMLR